jgi:AAA+ superfamily predicted ATPase
VSLDEWQEQNGRYLSAGLEWLRLRIERHAAAEPVRLPSAPAAARAEPRRRLFRSRGPEQPARIALPPASPTSLDDQLEEAAQAVAAAEAAMAAPPALVSLAERLGLTRFERELLLLCAAMELDTRLATQCARVQGPEHPYPTFALAFALFDDPSWDALSPERPLRYWRLLEITQPGAHPLTTSPLRADERIVNYVKGLNYVDDRLAPLLAPLEADDGESALPRSQQALVDRILARLGTASAAVQAPVVNLLGGDSPSKQAVARRVASALGRQLVRLPVALLPDQVGELETLARLWQRESAMMPVALFLDAHEVAVGEERQAPPLTRFLARSNGVFFLGSTEAWPGLARPPLRVDVAKPTPAEQQAAWAAELGPEHVETAAALAGQFDLNLASIQQAAELAREDGDGVHDRLWETCLLTTRPRLDVLATRLEPTATWDDLVLKREERELLRRIAAQVRRRPTVYDEWGFRDRMDRGLGVTALFAGDSGTGKTMAAGVIANDLRLDLYHIDLSGVVSKYIGETEKNLRRLFDAAEVGGAILFFDEADALFGKRSEVKDSHDRYANIEINYLLQRMEAYRGLAILATNMKSALDQAFMRRLRFVVDFPFPGLEERRAIWERVFPAGAPVEDVDLDRLASIVLTGGSIQNVALAAAFLAAQEETPVTMQLLLKAARTEFKKLGRPVNEADFRWAEPVAGVLA